MCVILSEINDMQKWKENYIIIIDINKDGGKKKVYTPY